MAAIDYLSLAFSYQKAYVAASQVPVWRLLKSATIDLHTVFDVFRAQSPVNPRHSVKPVEFAEALFTDPAARGSAEKKFIKWSQLPIEHGRNMNIPLSQAAETFEVAYLASSLNETVKRARIAKEVFKSATLHAFQEGEAIASLQSKLAGVDDVIHRKVQHWCNEF
jgi:hypothetical protein